MKIYSRFVFYTPVMFAGLDRDKGVADFGIKCEHSVCPPFSKISPETVWSITVKMYMELLGNEEGKFV